MSLHLESDSRLTVQSHLDELSIRLGRVLVLFVLMILVGWYWIDELLRGYISYLSPCSECIVVYSPTEWVWLRWLSIFILGLFLILPFLISEVIKFTRPAMMSFERAWFFNFLIISFILTTCTVFFTAFSLIPSWFLFAENAGNIEGVKSSYSASAMLEIVLVICFIEIVLCLSMVAAILLRKYGMAEGDNKISWQFRLHGTALFLMWLIIPSRHDTLLLLGILFELICVELSFSKINRGSFAIPKFNSEDGILDYEARLRRIAIVGCSCCDVVPVPNSDSIPNGMIYLPMQNFCESKELQDLLVEYALQLRLTDVIITGCGTSTINDNLKANLEFLNCQIRTLSLIDFSSMRIVNSNIIDIDFMIRLAVESDPWKDILSYDRVCEVLSRCCEEYRPKIAYWTKFEKPPFGTDILPNEILITSAKKPSSEIKLNFKKLGVDLQELGSI